MLMVCTGLLQHAAMATGDTTGIEKTSAGLGFGMDFGGFGFNFHHYIHKNVGLFAGVGYALADVGFNGGIKGRFLTGERTFGVFPFIEAMYGYNAAIVVENASEFNKMYYGPTFGVGLDWKPKPVSKGCWTIALLIPMRSDDVDAYMNDLEANHGVVFKSDLPPVGFSFGYRWAIYSFPAH